MIENLKTPSELIELFPDCDLNCREIGYLLMMKMVSGIKTRTSCLVTIESFESALELRDSVIKSTMKVSA